MTDALSRIFDDAGSASRVLATTSTETKNDALRAIAHALRKHSSRVIEANSRDVDHAEKEGMIPGLIDRLRLTEDRVEALAVAVEGIAELSDPIGEVVRERTLDNGLLLTEIRVPFGVVGSIYEARPNVTVDLAAILLKSGNAAVLRGGTAAENTNTVLVDVIGGALESTGLPRAAVQTIDTFGRVGATALMNARGFVDVLVPRGSAALINTVVAESRVPVIETGAGVVHIYIDDTADFATSRDIVHNAKTQRVGVCNALETLLIHRSVFDSIGIPVLEHLVDAGVTLHGDEEVCGAIPGALPATAEDWEREYLSMDLAVRVVDSLDTALEHIRRYSTGHTESILTASEENAERFLAEVDSAVVMVNASTRFTDGGEFGFGAEVGISTQKLHARGPMALPEMTSTKWIVRGNGQWRR